MSICRITMRSWNRGKAIEEYNLDELKTMFTFINRGERFCDGHIAAYVENGDLLRLLKRLNEIV